MHRNRVGLVIGALLGALDFSQAATVALVDENFASGTSSVATWTSSAAGVSNGQQWVFSGQSGETGVTAEMWTGTSGASARGLSQTYDHDNNAGTAAINIPGGFEVMSGFTSDGAPDIIRVTLSITLPALLDSSQSGLLTFFAANRISGSSGGNTPLVSIFNVTDNRDILAPTAITYPAGNANWSFKSNGISFLSTDAGDVIELRFQESITSGSGAGARGLEVADVDFTVQTIPEPSAAMIGLLSGMMLLRRRR